MKSELKLTLEWKPAPAGDAAPCHICEFKNCHVWQEPCYDCLRKKEYYDCYPVIAKSELCKQ